MGGTKAIVVALALLLGGSASAAADGPLDAGALQTVQQQAGTAVAPTAQQAGAIVQEATGIVKQTIASKPAPKPHAAATPAAAQVDAAPATTASGHASATAPRLPLARTAPSAQADHPGPPPHGHEVSPAARSRPGRARVASSRAKIAA